jgi:hypothetical protein
MTPQHKTLLTLGARGSRVRVYLEGALVRVRWRVNGVRRHRSWPNTPENRAEAKAFATGIEEARKNTGSRPTVRLTLRELWDRYQEAEFPALRPTSQVRYLERWRKWERFLGRDSIADATTQENADQYRTARTELGIAVNQIARGGEARQDGLCLGQASASPRPERARRVPVQDRQGGSPGVASRVPDWRTSAAFSPTSTLSSGATGARSPCSPCWATRGSAPTPPAISSGPRWISRPVCWSGGPGGTSWAGSGPSPSGPRPGRRSSGAAGR